MAGRQGTGEHIAMMTTLPDRSRLYAKIKSKDREARGSFFVGVRSTGIFCAPGCPARTPNEENCEFFASAAGAMQAGYRACKRCTPLESKFGSDEPAWVKAVVTHLREHPEQLLGAAELRGLGADPDDAVHWTDSRQSGGCGLVFVALRVGRALRFLAAFT